MTEVLRYFEKNAYSWSARFWTPDSFQGKFND